MFVLFFYRSPDVQINKKNALFFWEKRLFQIIVMEST
jgi:hypothetical protein